MIIYYENSKKEKINLLSQEYHIVNTDVFDARWDALTNGYEKKVEIDVIDEHNNIVDKMNHLYDVLAYDSENGSLGKLYVNGTYIKCSAVQIKKDGWKGLVRAYVTITFNAPILAWIEEESKDFMMTIVDENYGKKYPYDYPLDYAPPEIGMSYWYIDHVKDSEFAMIINGAVDDPEIVINGYHYRVFTTIQEGEYIIIDSQTKSIIKHLVDGTVLNIFDDRDVENSVFKKISPGKNIIEWSGAFSFKIYVYKERREPRWM